MTWSASEVVGSSAEADKIRLAAGTSSEVVIENASKVGMGSEAGTTLIAGAASSLVKVGRAYDLYRSWEWSTCSTVPSVVPTPNG